LGSATEPFHGPHQAGIATKLQSNAAIVAFDLLDGIGRADLVRLMRIWTDDAARLTQGIPALADPDATLAGVPARLTITLGFGAGALRAAGLADQAPAWLGPPPRFHGDVLQDRWSGGDLVLQVAAEDPVTVAHAVNVLVRDSVEFAGVRWLQRGFHRPANTAPAGITGRNLMGQVDGTVNPKPGTPQFDQAVWAKQPGWLSGGTGMVVRRIAMDLPVWGSLDQRTKEQAIGRRLADGAPLTGGTETTPADFDAVDANGFPVIPELSHMRLARAMRPVEVILRRPFNYDDGYVDSKPDAGLVFVAFAADPGVQYVPIQQRISKSDVMNIWLRVIGSAVFAIPPGPAPGEYLGQGLLG
jgi:dye decolorizing peroxidase